MRAIRLVSATATSMRRRAHQHPGEPWVVRPAAPSRPADDRDGARDQEPPQIALAHLRYSAKLRLAAGRVLARHQAEPGGKVPVAPEGLHRRREGLNRHRGDRADPGTVIRRRTSSSCRAAASISSSRLSIFVPSPAICSSRRPVISRTVSGKSRSGSSSADTKRPT